MMDPAKDQQCIPEDGPLLVVISGPSGVGKDAVISHLRRTGRPIHVVVTATTRPRRPVERDGVDYLFISEERFQEMVRRGEFLEYAQVYGRWYGVPRSQVREALSKGVDAIVKTDVQGAATIKKGVPEAVFVFLAPPSMEELERRLRQRKTESPEQLALRVRTAQEEMCCLPTFDYVVVNHNDRLEETASRLDAIIAAEKCRIPPRRVQV
ncbi:MAG: guanylate kinase [Chloroflexi bacterium]|nr:guanylate kinase [Chloroflexota bacterium]